MQILLSRWQLLYFLMQISVQRYYATTNFKINWHLLPFQLPKTQREPVVSLCTETILLLIWKEKTCFWNNADIYIYIYIYMYLYVELKKTQKTLKTGKKVCCNAHSTCQPSSNVQSVSNSEYRWVWSHFRVIMFVNLKHIWNWKKCVLKLKVWFWTSNVKIKKNV